MAYMDVGIPPIRSSTFNLLMLVFFEGDNALERKVVLESIMGVFFNTKGLQEG